MVMQLWHRLITSHLIQSMLHIHRVTLFHSVMKSVLITTKDKKILNKLKYSFIIIMIEKFSNNPKLSYFIAYSLSFVAYGGAITGIGPLIPYLAAISHEKQTQFAVLFFWRALGFFCAGFVVKFFEKRMTMHNSLILFSILCGVLLSLFSFSAYYSRTVQSVCIFFSAVSYASLEILINVGMIVTHKHNDVEFWLQLNHGVFGIGGLIGPFLVYIFQTNSFMVIGLCMAAVSPLYYFLPTPQGTRTPSEQKLLQQQNKDDNTKISTKAQYILCGIFFLYLGLESTFGGWISSYAVINQIATKQEATKYGSIFWISMTFFRFLFACISGKTSKKIIWLSSGSVASSIVAIVIIYLGFQLQAIWFAAIMLGMFYAPLFPLQYALPSQYKFHLTVSQSANLITASAIGQAGPSMVAGYLMGIFSSQMLFYSLAFIAVCHLLLSIILVYDFEKGQKKSVFDFITNTKLKPANKVELQDIELKNISKKKKKDIN